MKRFFWSCCIVLIGFLLAPCSSFALMHISNTCMSSPVVCGACHPDGPHASQPECTQCHINTDGPPYSDQNTIGMPTHSSAVIGSGSNYEFTKECLDCHQHHTHNGLEKALIEARLDVCYTTSDPCIVGDYLPDGYVLMDFVANRAVSNDPLTKTTFEITDLHIHDPAWEDPATWGEKTSGERGLIFVMWNGGDRKFKTYEILSATDTHVTIGNECTFFPGAQWDNSIFVQVIYGMLLQNEIPHQNHTWGYGSPVNAGGPSTMANDELGDGTDETPDGICQVCHTQTTHWRSDGSFANHFSGWKCTLCHPHEEGFKADPPLLCPIPVP